MDLLLLIFVYVGYRSGSTFWLWWVMVEGLMGTALLGIGIYLRAYGIGAEPPPQRED